MANIELVRDETHACTHAHTHPHIQGFRGGTLGGCVFISEENLTTIIYTQVAADIMNWALKHIMFMAKSNAGGKRINSTHGSINGSVCSDSK